MRHKMMHPTEEGPNYKLWVEHLMPHLEVVDRKLRARSGSLAVWRVIISEITEVERWAYRNRMPWFLAHIGFLVPFMGCGRDHDAFEPGGQLDVGERVAGWPRQG